MQQAEPQITEISKVFATRLPTKGVEQLESIDAWRAVLRYARSHGFIDDLVEVIKKTDPSDRVVAVLCEELVR